MAVFRDVDVNCVSRNQPGGSAKNVPAAAQPVAKLVFLYCLFGWSIENKKKKSKNHLVK